MNPTVTALTVTPPTFPAHVAARIAKSYGPSRPALTAGWFPVAADPRDSDPDMDEALRRATTEVTYLQQEQDIRDQVEVAYAERADLPRAEYRAWAYGEAA